MTTPDHEHDEERLADRGVDHATVEPVSPAECESEPVGATDHAHWRAAESSWGV